MTAAHVDPLLDLDRDYLRATAARMNLTNLLERAYAAANAD
jgi:hypothetical protein